MVDTDLNYNLETGAKKETVIFVIYKKMATRKN